MDVNASHDSEKSKLGFITDMHVLKVVVIQNTV